MDVDLIIRRSFKSSYFNDDALARTLDKIHDASIIMDSGSANAVGYEHTAQNALDLFFFSYTVV